MQYKLKECREKAGYSQLQAGLEIGTSQQMISQWERGTKDIVFRKAIQLANLYKCTLDELAGRNKTDFL